jgi:hypothetical protein
MLRDAHNNNKCVHEIKISKEILKKQIIRRKLRGALRKHLKILENQTSAVVIN